MIHLGHQARGNRIPVTERGREVAIKFEMTINFQDGLCPGTNVFAFRNIVRP